MQKRSAIFCLFLAAVSVSAAAGFSPTLHLEPGADAYASALDIYASSPEAGQGVYARDGLVFVVAAVDKTPGSSNRAEANAMLRVSSLLRGSYPNLPASFQIDRRVLENRFVGNVLRYAVVCREKDIQAIAARNPAAVSRPVPGSILGTPGKIPSLMIPASFPDAVHAPNTETSAAPSAVPGPSTRVLLHGCVDTNSAGVSASPESRPTPPAVMRGSILESAQDNLLDP